MLWLLHHHWLFFIMGLVSKHVLVVLAKFVVGHTSIWFAWSIHFDSDGVLAHVSKPLPALAPKMQHQFTENLALQRPRVVFTEDTTYIKLPHFLGRYRSFVGGLVQSPGLQVLKKAYKTWFPDMNSLSCAMLICLECCGDCRWQLIAALMFMYELLLYCRPSWRRKAV